MTNQEIITLINANPACHLATVSSAKPAVRGMLIYRAAPNEIIFHTGSFKELYTQLEANPNVEFCFNDFAAGKQVRVRGTAKKTDDSALKAEIMGKRPFLKNIADEKGDDALIVYKVTNLTATVWTMSSNTAPTVFNPLN